MHFNGLVRRVSNFGFFGLRKGQDHGLTGSLPLLSFCVVAAAATGTVWWHAADIDFAAAQPSPARRDVIADALLQFVL